MSRKPNENSEYPSSVTLKQFYSYFEEDNSYKAYQAGFTATDPDDIKALVDRKAPLKD